MKPMMLMFHSEKGYRVTCGIREAWRMLRHSRGVYAARSVIARVNSGETVYINATGHGNLYFAISEDYLAEKD
jgi:hypothetical protein